MQQSNQSTCVPETTDTTQTAIISGIDSRAEQSFAVRVTAAKLAKVFPDTVHVSNGDEDRFTDSCSNLTHIASYTKGLPHNRLTGLIEDPAHFQLFIKAIDSPTFENIVNVPLGPQNVAPEHRFKSGIATGRPGVTDVRAWESMGAGMAFDLEGPDAQAVTMPPAPVLEGPELATEMMENYWMALLRDVPFFEFDNSELVKKAVASLNCSPWVNVDPNTVTEEEKRRLRGPFTTQTVFRGNTPGEQVGPYLSQFLLAGNTGLGAAHSEADGFIMYGGMRMDQRVRVATPYRDYMTTWESFLDVQNGADLRGLESYEGTGDNGYRFMFTPRELSTYVHYDALYQAYLNACIILLNLGVGFDKGIPFQLDDDVDHQQGFAHFGGPHILSLVTEVATRALKAVRFQKFNTHRRGRPEAVAGLIERFKHEPRNPLYAGVKNLYKSIDPELLDLVAKHNAEQNTMSDFGKPRRNDFSPTGESKETLLLPMAFPEGSPMHPAYGAGHATVAGACVTVLKAFFNHKATLPYAFVPVNKGRSLSNIVGDLGEKLTVEGELNKLCANISIGRDWAGVHWYTDYRESIILGEKVALGILKEQALTFGEPFSMTVPLFDGKKCAIITNKTN